MSKLFIAGNSTHMTMPDWVKVKFRLSSNYKDNALATKDILNQYKTIKEVLADHDLVPKRYRYFTGLDYRLRKILPLDYASDSQETFKDDDSHTEDVIGTDYDRRLERIWSSHDYIIEFAMNDDLLSKIIMLITDNDKGCGLFNVVFLVKNEQTVKDIVLQKAVENAVHKANIVAKCLGSKIIGIEELKAISFEDDLGETTEDTEREFTTEFAESSWNYERCEKEDSPKFTNAFVPCDIKYSCGVHVTFIISEKLNLTADD